MYIQSRDIYSFGLQLLNVLLTKKELTTSLLFQKSDKPGLDQGREEKHCRGGLAVIGTCEPSHRR